MSRRPGRIALGALVVICLVAWGHPTAGDDTRDLLVRHPVGRIALYKNNYRYEYVSDHGYQILSEASPPKWVELVIDGEWRSREVVESVDDSTGVAAISATISSAYSAASKGAQRLSYQQYPATLEELDGRAFTWQVSPGVGTQNFRPGFELYSLPRKDLVTDLGQIWMVNYCPAIPEGPVAVGDSWEGEQTFALPFIETRDTARVVCKSTYTVKKAKKKKGHATLEIEEQCQVQYTGWIHVSSASIVVSGAGKGVGTWVIDTTDGVVLKRESRIELDNPEVRMESSEKPFGTVQAEVKIQVKRELKKLEAP